MEMPMRIRTIITTLLLMATVVVSAQGLKTTVDEDRKAEVRKTLAFPIISMVQKPKPLNNIIKIR